MQALKLFLLFSFWINHLNHANAQLGAEHAGKASFYAKIFKGKKTACGERFSNEAMTAAHRTLPFNTMIEVTNLANDKTVVVRVTDRGPYSRGRVLDLSRAAAHQLDFIKRGETKVKIRVVGMQGMVFLGRNDLITDVGEIIEATVQPPLQRQ